MEGSSSEEYVSADEGPGENDRETAAHASQPVNNGLTDGNSEQKDKDGVEILSEERTESASTHLPGPAEGTSSTPPEGVVSSAPVCVVTSAVEAVLVPIEGPPVPPPRRKRKKKCEKQPSLENLAETEIDPPRARSMTVGSTSLSRTHTTPHTDRHLGEGGRSSSPTTPPQSHPADSAAQQPVPAVVQGSSVDDKRVSSHEPQPGTSDQHSQRGTSQDSSDSLMQDRVSSQSRSVTPTPAISIEPDLGLEWTADMLSLKESEVVTSDTSLAKARGSTATTTSSMVYPSDDDSLDGDAVFGEDTPEEGGEGEGEGPTQPDHTSNQPEQEANRGTGGTDSDNAILESTMVKNLDTGEVIPLSAAEEKIPQGHGWSPLSEHLLRRTKEIAEAEGQQGSYDDDYNPHRRKSRRKPFIKLKKWGKKRDRFSHEDGTGQLDEATPEDRFAVKYKQAHHKQSQQEFDKVRLRQDLTGTHLGAIWSMEFSICGRLLATAGQDSVVRVWVLTTAALFFHELQAQYQRLGVHSSVDSLSEKASVASSSSKSSEEDDNQGGKLPFQEQPLCSYYGHTADVLDLSWSKNFFLLSSSMDKTVRLWHISRKECLCVFQHVDFVTAIAFHPRDDRYFLSGSLDGKLRLWNIPDKRVALWNEIEGVGSHLITAANFCMNGKLAVVGTYDGRCMFYDTEHLKYHTQIHVKSRHGKNKGRKISGVEPLPGEDKLLVTSNDSRVRLYNLKDHELSCKYKGCLNTSSQIKATFSRDGQYIISGSEDNFIYIWKTHMDVSKLSSARRDRNEFYESFTSHSAPVTTAVFAPVPGITVDEGIKEVGEMVVAADYQGAIKIYVSGEKL